VCISLEHKTRDAAILVLTFIIIMTVLGLAINSLFAHKETHVPSGGFTYILPGYDTVVGNNTASDGRLIITLNNYAFANASDLYRYTKSDAFLVGDIYMLLNMTVSNVGGDNTSILASFFIIYSYQGTMESNGIYAAGVTFSGLNPNQTYPSTDGGLYLPPGKTARFWIISNVESSHIKLLKLIYLEHIYGGNYLGNGQYSGGVESLSVEFIITPTPNQPIVLNLQSLGTDTMQRQNIKDELELLQTY
jgi:hypothetical protein